MFKRLWLIEVMVLVLLISVSSAALWLQHSQAVKRISLLNHPELRWEVLSDLVDRGLSDVRLEEMDDHWVMHCELKESRYPWPYCALRFHLPLAEQQGWDLEQLLGIEIKTRHLSLPTDQSDSLRLQLLNHHPQYAKAGQIATLKYQGYEFSPREQRLFIPRDNIQVYTWWIINRSSIAPEHQLTDLSNVHIIELATSSLARPGEFVIAVDELNLVLPLIANLEQFNRLIIYAWLAGALLILSLRLRVAQLNLRASLANRQELATLNQQLENKQLQLQRVANHDPLTHALNRAGFGHAISKLPSNEWPLTLMLLDLDHFKDVNDNFGHEMGDQVLQQFSLLLRQQLRSRDILARWGGEEFLIALTHSNNEQGVQFCQRLQRAMTQAPWQHAGRLTASIGLSHAKDESELGLAIQQADKALYQRKNAGRDGFQLFQTGAEPHDPSARS